MVDDNADFTSPQINAPVPGGVTASEFTPTPI